MHAKAKKTTAGLKELRENMETYIKRVNKGESITVFRRSTPLFKLTPIDAEEVGWETVVDFTKINKNGVPATDVLAAIKKCMDRITKFLSKLDKNELSQAEEVTPYTTAAI